MFLVEVGAEDGAGGGANGVCDEDHVGAGEGGGGEVCDGGGGRAEVVEEGDAVGVLVVGELVVDMIGVFQGIGGMK